MHINADELRRLIEPATGLLPLTPRLLDVFIEVCCGRTSVEIAAALGISPATAETEMKLLFGRLGVSGHRAVRSIGMSMLIVLVKQARGGGGGETPVA